MGKLLILTIGLPRSGKSTWAKKQGIPIVNLDSIRLALHGKAYIQEAESMIWTIAKYMVKSLFIAGHDKVIVDATNTTSKRRKFWKSDEWTNSYYYIYCSEKICIERAIKTNRQDLIPVIERMADQLDISDIECKLINGEY